MLIPLYARTTLCLEDLTRSVVYIFRCDVL